MKMMRRWQIGVFWEWEEMKSAEQWCFSIVKISEGSIESSL
jgi:hypothetical protein